HHVLIVYADTVVPTTLGNQILALLSSGATVVYSNALSAIPSLAQLQRYDVVVPFSNYPFNSSADQITMGDNLADYIDGGGSVVAFNFDWHESTYAIQGRWLSGGYSPYNNLHTTYWVDGTLGAYTSGHPLMAGVTTLNA